MSRRTAYSVYVSNIRDAIERASTFVAGKSFEEFAGDDMRIYATVRTLEIVGEATKRLPQQIRDLEPDLPWQSMAGMRDVIIHQYDAVDLAIVWATVQQNLPPLVPQLERLKRVLEQQEDEDWECG